MILKVATGYSCIALVLVIWDFSPLKSYVYLEKSKFIGRVHCLRLYIRIKLMKKISLFLRIAIELWIIWFVFEWKEGKIINGIENLIKRVGVRMVPVRKGLVFLTPYGRTIATNEGFKYALDICSVCLAIGVIILLLIAFSSNFKCCISKIFVVILFGLCIWYVLFGVCHFIIKIPWNFLVIFASVISVLILLIISIVPFLDIIDKLN